MGAVPTPNPSKPPLTRYLALPFQVRYELIGVKATRTPHFFPRQFRPKEVISSGVGSPNRTERLPAIGIAIAAPPDPMRCTPAHSTPNKSVRSGSIRRCSGTLFPRPTTYPRHPPTLARPYLSLSCCVPSKTLSRSSASLFPLFFFRPSPHHSPLLIFHCLFLRNFIVASLSPISAQIIPWFYLSN